MLVVGKEAVPDVIGREVNMIAALLYVEYGILASPWTAGLQDNLEFLTGLFNRVGLLTNM